MDGFPKASIASPGHFRISFKDEQKNISLDCLSLEGNFGAY